MDVALIQELQAEAAADLPPPDVATEEAPPAAAPLDPAQEWEIAIKLAIMLAAPMAPFLPTIYTEETIGHLARAIVPVADKYGWNTGGLLERFGPEIGLAMIAGPLVLRTSQAWQAYRESLRAAKAKPVEEADGRQATPAASPVPATEAEILR